MSDMPPPALPASASADPGPSRKRARDEEFEQGSASAASSATAFSVTTKRRLRILTNNRCWHCGVVSIQACHVIAQADQAFSDLRSRGLVNIASTRDFNNAVGLCNTCHIQFDHSPAAGFVFFPSDLNFFVDYEMRDRERRKNEALSQGPDAPPRPIRRRCPSAVQYHEHQQAAGVVAAEAVGGLYDRYMLREYFPLLGAGQVFAPAPWHGDPMTSLRRAFLQLGGLRAFKVSKATRKILFELLQLYYEEDTEEFELSQPEEQAAQVVEGSARDYLRTPTPSVQFSEGRRNESTAPQDLNARGFSVNDKASLALASPAANAKREQSQTFSPGTADAHQEWPEHGWEWGPGATAQHAVDFWTSIKNIPAQRNGKGSQAHAAH